MVFSHARGRGEPTAGGGGTSSTVARVLRPATAGAGWVADWLQAVAGGPARLKVIVLLSSVLASVGADQSVLGAVAPGIKDALGLGNTQMGVLVSATGLAAAVSILPFGVLADRAQRVRLLVIGIGICVAGIAVAGAADSFLMMLLAVVGLGIGVGAVNPAVASLTGDLFPAAARGRIYGYILAGEIIGSAIGLLLAGEVGALSWRAAFWVVALPAVALIIALAKTLPEPARRGHSRLGVGAEEIVPADEVGSCGGAPGEAGGRAGDDAAGARAGDDEARGRAGDAETGGETGGEPGDEAPGDGCDPTGADPGTPGHEDDDAAAEPAGALPQAIETSTAEPEPSRVLHEDPSGRPLWWAVRYVLSIPTNVVLIVASALGYFFFAGLQTFAVVYLRSRYDMGQGMAGLVLVGIGSGALLGILTSGRLADRLIARHFAAARPVVGGVAFVLAAGLFLPALASGSLAVAFPLLFIAAAAVGAMNPPIDAARLDIMHSRLWGRAESVRTFLQTLLKSAAPVLLGYLSGVLGGAQARGGGAHSAQNAAAGQGLAYALMLMLVPLLVAGILLLTVGRRYYPTDVATAMASEP